MSFNQKNFGPIGGENMVAPAQWSYRTGDDAIAEVSAAGYFNDKVYQLESGDNIYIAASDSVGLYEIVNDGEQITLTSITSGGGGGGVESVSAQERVLVFPLGSSWETRFSSTYPFTDESLSGSGKFSEPLSVLIDGISESASRLFLTPAERALIADQSGINTGDETTLTIQTKRPIKTVNGESLEGAGNIAIAGGGVQSVTGEGVGGTAANPVMSFPDADEVSDTSTANKWSSAAEKQSITDNTADIAVLDTYIEHGRRSSLTPDNPLIIDGAADQFETIDTYTFSIANADTYKLAVIIAWNLDSPQQKAIFEFELDSTVILEATLEPKDGQNDDFLFVFGLRDLTAGSHTIVAKGTKTNAAAVLTIDGCSWTRNRIILDT